MPYFVIQTVYKCVSFVLHVCDFAVVFPGSDKYLSVSGGQSVTHIFKYVDNVFHHHDNKRKTTKLACRYGYSEP